MARYPFPEHLGRPGFERLISGKAAVVVTTGLAVTTMVIALCAGSLRMAASPPAADDLAVLVNSGSTNTMGFRIVVERSGDAECTATARRAGSQPNDRVESMRQHVPNTLVQRLYSDLEKAKPFASLPRRLCMKSASFGTTLTIEFGGDKTPDLNCGSGYDSNLEALIRDANEIIRLFRTR
jgi:hypothetical protein